jgi:hypothetical protein
VGVSFETEYPANLPLEAVEAYKAGIVKCLEEKFEEMKRLG